MSVTREEWLEQVGGNDAPTPTTAPEPYTFRVDIGGCTHLLTTKEVEALRGRIAAALVPPPATTTPEGLRDAAQAVVNGWRGYSSATETDELMDALAAALASCDSAETRGIGQELERISAAAVAHFPTFRPEEGPVLFESGVSVQAVVRFVLALTPDSAVPTPEPAEERA